MKHLTSVFLVYLIFISFPTSAKTNSWQSQFYLDDTQYYQTLFKDGFIQSIRVNKSSCYKIRKIWIELINGRKFFFQKSNGPLKNLYGHNQNDYCWFQARVSGENISKPHELKYILVFQDDTNQNYYLENVTSSLLLKNRIKKNRSNLCYMTPGTQGANHVKNGGILFKIWEPNAQIVHLFINNNIQPYVLFADREINNPIRNHLIYLDNADDKTKYRYKFMKNGAYEKVDLNKDEIFKEFKIDPMAKEISYSNKSALLNGYADAYGVVGKLEKYNWSHDNTIKKLKNEPWMIYQLWPMAFNPKATGKTIRPGTINNIIEKIDYLVDLGINAVELLPIHEFRFKVSWGYMLDSLILIEKSYGKPKDLMALSDQLHQKGINLILDIVFNHVNNGLIRDPISEVVTESKYYKGDTGWGPRPRFSSIMVKKWITDSIVSLVRDYHIDGLRFDMIKFIHQNNFHGHLLLQELTTILKSIQPKIHLMAEELPDNIWATKPVLKGGMGFDSQWNDQFKNTFEHDFDIYKINNRNINISNLVRSLHGFSNQGNNKFKAPYQTINYIGSHDFVGNKNPILRIVSDYSSYETVGSNRFLRVKPLMETIQLERKFRLIHNNFTHAFARLAYGILFTKPGHILFFQGEELASDINIQNEWDYIEEKKKLPTRNVDLERFIFSHKMPWEYKNPFNEETLSFLSNKELTLFTGHLNFFKDMINFRKNNPLLDDNAYNVRTSYQNTVLSYQIKTNNHEYFIIANFGYDMGSAWISFPETTKDWWEEILNSSIPNYGGSSEQYLNIVRQMGGRSNLVRLKGPSISIFKKTHTPSISRNLYLVGNINNWKTTPDFLLIQSERENILKQSFYIQEQGTYQFKLSTENWKIEMGSDDNLLNSTLQGQLSYAPNMPNIKVSLKKGRYLFTFNLETFKYNFQHIDEGA